MSLNLIAVLGEAWMTDSAQGEQLISMVRNLGGRIALFGPEGIRPTGGEDLPEPITVEGVRGELERQRMAIDETVFLASTESDAQLARSIRLKIGSISPNLVGDENWLDLHDATRWFERQGQLAKRAWPIATVGGLVFAPDGTALFVRTAKWGGTWGVPGGKIDYGETHLQAFLREIREETGLEATSPEFVLVQDAIEEPEFFRPRHFLLLNYRACSDTKEFRLNHESLEAGWFTLQEALRHPLNRPTRLLVEHLLTRTQN